MKKVRLLSLFTAVMLVFSSLPVMAQASDESVTDEWKAWDSMEIADSAWSGNDAEVSACALNAYLATDDYKTADSGTLFTINKTLKKGVAYEISFKVRSYEDEQRRSIRIWVGTTTSTKNMKLCYQGALDGTTADGLPKKDGCELSSADSEGWYSVTLTYTPEKEKDTHYLVVSGDYDSNNEKYNASGLLPMDFDDFKLDGELLDGGDFSMGVTTDEFAWKSFKTQVEPINKLINIEVKNELTWGSSNSEEATDGTVEKYLTAYNFTSASYGMRFRLNGDFAENTEYVLSFRIRSHSEDSPQLIRFYAGSPDKKKEIDDDKALLNDTKPLYNGELKTVADGETVSIGEQDVNGWHTVTIKHTPSKNVSYIKIAILGGTGGGNNGLDPTLGNGVSPLDFDDVKINGKLVDGGDFSLGQTTDEFKWGDFYRDGVYSIVSEIPYTKVVPESISGGAEYIYRDVLNPGDYVLTFKARLDGFDYTEGFAEGSTKYDPDLAKSNNYRYIGLDLYRGGTCMTEEYAVSAVQETGDEFKIGNEWNDEWVDITYKFTVPEGGAVNNLSFLIGSGESQDTRNSRAFDMRDAVLYGENLFSDNIEKGTLNTGILMVLLKKKHIAEDSTEETVKVEIEIENSYLATDEYKTPDSGTLFTINKAFEKGETYEISFKVRSYEDEQRRSIRIWAGTSTSTKEMKLCYQGALDGTTADGLPKKDGCEISSADSEGWYLVTLAYVPEGNTSFVNIIVSGDYDSNNNKYNASGLLPMDFDDFKLGGELLAGGDFSNGDASDEFNWRSFKTGEKIINLKVKDETVTVVSEVPIDDTAD
ncbi:MAG: hypothetical protein IJ428_04215 [Clostridia bacterium]|nr:hypothetical protein [Clostridia bacterium]